MMTVNMSRQQVMGQENNKKVLHREVLRVKDEDLRIQEGITIGERLDIIVKDGVSEQLRAVVLSKPFLPCSPLGGKPNCAAAPVKAMPMQP